MHRVEIGRLAHKQEQNLRKSERKRELTAGLFARDDYSEPLCCLIRDLSEEGAQIRINATEPLPEPGYIINLKTRSAQEARAVWRQGSVTGLSLGKKYAINDTLPNNLVFLKSLFTEAKLRQIDQMISEGVGSLAAVRKCGVTEEFYRRGRGMFLH